MNKHELLWRGIWGLDAADLSDPKAGGVVIFARNLDPDPETGPERLFNLNNDIQKIWGADCPVAIAIDQEGGKVSRLRKWVGETPPLRQIWLTGRERDCELWGRLWGQGLTLLGISVDFAPVLDLYDGREETGLGSRCASEDPEETAAAAGAFLDGIESTGVRGCLKHFPGLCGTDIDSHIAMPSISDPATIAKNVIPFLRLANSDRLIMVAHLQTPTSEGIPASLHRSYVAENRWGISGRWIPDDMEMGGCQASDWNTRVAQAIKAGHQALLVCQTPEAVKQAADAAKALDDSMAGSAIEAFRSLRKTLKPMPKSFDKTSWMAWLDEVQRQSEKVLQLD
uniref:beta-N-acetylhexosaminidase n=1 Tax=uncultured bacterium contig00038 TaxID=1181526 RepID=A0A806K138_9BACT|nr:beta-hexosaminidase [uncultured bacterium contig00038]